MEDHLGRRISKEDDGDAAKPTRSFRYEDYSTRRVFLRSYPLQWDWSPSPGDDDKDGLSPDEAAAAAAAGRNKADGADGDECCGGSRGWKRQVVEWGEDKLLLLQRAKKRLALYLIGCSRHHHHGHRGRALPFPSAGGSCTVAMLSSG